MDRIDLRQFINLINYKWGGDITSFRLSFVYMLAYTCTDFKYLGILSHYQPEGHTSEFAEEHSMYGHKYEYIFNFIDRLSYQQLIFFFTLVNNMVKPNNVSRGEKIVTCKSSCKRRNTFLFTFGPSMEIWRTFCLSTVRDSWIFSKIWLASACPIKYDVRYRVTTFK